MIKWGTEGSIGWGNGSSSVSQQGEVVNTGRAEHCVWAEKSGWGKKVENQTGKAVGCCYTNKGQPLSAIIYKWKVRKIRLCRTILYFAKNKNLSVHVQLDHQNKLKIRTLLFQIPATLTRKA